MDEDSSGAKEGNEFQLLFDEVPVQAKLVQEGVLKAECPGKILVSLPSSRKMQKNENIIFISDTKKKLCIEKGVFCNCIFIKKKGVF